MTARLLIVALNQMLVLHFEDDGFAVEGVVNCAEALEQIDANAFYLVLLDQRLPDGTGTELLGAILSREPELPVVMMTGQHHLDLAIEAIKQRAADFIHKPVETAELTATANRRLSREVEALRGGEPHLSPFSRQRPATPACGRPASP